MKPGYEVGESALNNVHYFLDKHLIERPELPVFRWVDPADAQAWLVNREGPLPHQSIDVRTLHMLVDHAACGLKGLGINKGDRVIVFIPMSLPMYVAMFALQKIGAIPVFLDSWARRDHLGVSAEIVAPKAIISVEKAFQYLAEVPEIGQIPIRVVVGPSSENYSARLETLMASPGQMEVTPVEREHTGLITFTTGSSGKPKGANRTHRFLFAQHYALDPCIPYEMRDVDLPVFPIFSLNNLAAGVATVIPAFDIGVPGPHDPEIILAQIQACDVTCVTLSPSLFNRLSAYCLAQDIQLPQLRRVVTGGAPIGRDNVVDMQKVAANAEILILFGSTEVEPMAHIEGHEMVNLKSQAMEDENWVDEGVNVGKMVDTLSYRFIKIQSGPVTIKDKSDWDALLVDQGEVSQGEASQVGELIVAGEHVCQSYYNDEVAFIRAKIRDENGQVWHRTGDLGRVDENGYLWIVGRVHNAIQRAGRYHFPVRAEMVLKKLPFADRVAYLGIPDPELGEKTVAVLTLSNKNSDAKTNFEYQQKAKALLDYNGIPADLILFLDSIPMDPRHHSKVEYDRLRQRLIEEKLA